MDEKGPCAVWWRGLSVLLALAVALALVSEPALAEAVATTPASTSATTEPAVAPAATSAATPDAAATPEAVETPVAPAQADPVAFAADSGTPAEAAQARVSVAVIGPDAAGNDSYWANPTYEQAAPSESAWDVVKRAFRTAGLASYDATEGTAYGTYLNAIASPLTGKTLGYDAATGRYWQLFVNGASSDVGISSLELKDGDAVVWKYSAWGDASGTTVGAVVYDSPTTELPAYEADWPESETGGNVTSATTPTSGATALWSTLVGGGSSTSAPLLVNERVYLAVGASFMAGSSGGAYATRLVRVDAATGSVEATGQLAGDISYTSRPLYAGGMVFVALADGSVQALNAETMLTRWVSRPVDGCSSSQCAIRCADGIVYVETASGLDASGAAASGSVLALDEATGAVRWQATNADSGYNWTGAVLSGSSVVVGDTAGTLHALDAASGSQASTFSLGSTPVNADPVACQGRLLVMTRDGTLHVVTVDANGILAKVASLKVLGGCKSAPTIVGTKAIVAGSSLDGASSAVAVVDLATMRVERTVTRAGGSPLALGLGGISGPVLVSRQASGTYCYFALNDATPTDTTYSSYSTGGDVYSYRLGDDEASPFYLPSGANAQYCDYPLVCDASGGLYYLNDSGYLVRLVAGPTPARQETPDGASSPSGGSGRQATSNGSGAAPISLISPMTLARSSARATVGTTPGTPGTSLQATLAVAVADGQGVSSADAQAPRQDVAPPADRALPVWPVVGMGLGCAALLGALLWHRGRPGGEVA